MNQPITLTALSLPPTPSHTLSVSAGLCASLCFLCSLSLSPSVGAWPIPRQHDVCATNQRKDVRTKGREDERPDIQSGRPQLRQHYVTPHTRGHRAGWLGSQRSAPPSEAFHSGRPARQHFLYNPGHTGWLSRFPQSRNVRSSTRGFPLKSLAIHLYKIIKRRPSHRFFQSIHYTYLYVQY